MQLLCVLCCKQKTAYVMRISYWCSDGCSSGLPVVEGLEANANVLAVHLPRHPKIQRRPGIGPVLYTLSLLLDAGDDAGADGAAALADGEAQALVHRDRRDQLDRHGHVVARHHHLRDRKSTRLNSSH